MIKFRSAIAVAVAAQSKSLEEIAETIGVHLKSGVWNADEWLDYFWHLIALFTAHGKETGEGDIHE